MTENIKNTEREGTGDEFSRSMTLQQKIDTLGFHEKFKLAISGSWSERSILVRDRNKTIAATVLKSPKTTEQEVVAIAQMRNVDEEVLRQIGQNRQWIRAYPIILSLVNNPKTPIAVALNFMNRLTNKDLKALKMSKNVPEAVAKKAGRMFAARTGGRMTPKSV